MKKKILYSILTAFLLSLSFPPFKLGFLAYIALIPFFVLLEDLNYKDSIKWGYLTGLFTNIGTLYWINFVTIPGAIAAIFYLPVYLVFYSLLHTFFRKKLGEGKLYFWIPFLWTGIEYFKSLGVLGFPWNSLAYTQTYYLSLIQYVTYTSVYGVTFWIVIINVIILLLLKNISNYKKNIIYFLILVFLFLIPWIYGTLIVPEPNGNNEEKIRVALIQGNIDPYLKWDDSFIDQNLTIYDKLTRESAKSNPDLIIWPETATPVYLRDSVTYLMEIRQMIADLNIPLITGTPDYKFFKDRSYKTYNAAFLMKPFTNDFQLYHKIHLVPFGEQVPFTETVPFFKDFLEKLEMGEGNFSSGNKVVSFKVPFYHEQKNNCQNDSLTKNEILTPVIICFESLFPEFVRKFIQKGADIMVIITNDAWFERSSAPFHHAQVAVFRAIENRICIARCANTGISMFIDPYGRTLASTSIFEQTTLIHDIPLRKGTTFFIKHGNIFSYAISVLNFIPFIAAFFTNRKSKIMYSKS